MGRETPEAGIRAPAKPSIIMQATKDKVVTIHYTLTGEDGEVIDSSAGGDPLAYLHGAGNIVTGLESALEGKAAGDKVEVTVAPEDGYGEVDPALRGEIPVERFGDTDPEVGMRFRAETPDGMVVLEVTEVGEEIVQVDGNHPLAGEVLHFAVEIVEIREATAEELAHGHAHGIHGHDEDH